MKKKKIALWLYPNGMIEIGTRTGRVLLIRPESILSLWLGKDDEFYYVTTEENEGYGRSSAVEVSLDTGEAILHKHFKKVTKLL